MVSEMPKDIKRATSPKSQRMTPNQGGDVSETTGYHIGDPCYFCGVAHDDVPAGPCPVASVADAADLDVFAEFEECNRDPFGWDGYHVEDVRNMAATFLRVLRKGRMTPNRTRSER